MNRLQNIYILGDLIEAVGDAIGNIFSQSAGNFSLFPCTRNREIFVFKTSLVSALVRASGIVRLATRRYVAATDLDSALRRTLALKQTGYLTCITYLQQALDETSARNNLTKYQEILDLVRVSELRPTVNVSLSQLGFSIDRFLGQELLRLLIVHAVQRDGVVWLDTSPFVDSQSNLETAIQLNRLPGFGGHVGLAIRGDLFRTKQDIDSAVQEKLEIRLHATAHSADKGPTIKGAGNIRSHCRRLAELLLSSGTYCSFMTRDATLVGQIIEIATLNNASSGSFEFQFPDNVQIPRMLEPGGCRVRILVPFGPESADYVEERLLGY